MSAGSLCTPLWYRIRLHLIPQLVCQVTPRGRHQSLLSSSQRLLRLPVVRPSSHFFLFGEVRDARISTWSIHSRTCAAWFCSARNLRISFSFWSRITLCLRSVACGSFSQFGWVGHAGCRRIFRWSPYCESVWIWNPFWTGFSLGCENHRTYWKWSANIIWRCAYCRFGVDERLRFSRGDGRRLSFYFCCRQEKGWRNCSVPTQGRNCCCVQSEELGSADLQVCPSFTTLEPVPCHTAIQFRIPRPRRRGRNVPLSLSTARCEKPRPASVAFSLTTEGAVAALGVGCSSSVGSSDEVFVDELIVHILRKLFHLHRSD